MILFIENSSAVTGGFRSAMAMLAAIESDVVMVLPVESACTDTVRQSARPCEVVELPMRELSKNWTALIYLPVLLINALRLYSIVKSRDVTVVHVNDMYNLLGVALKILRPSLIVVYHVRLMPDAYIAPIYPFLRGLLRRFSDHILCVSKAVYQAWDDIPQAKVVFDAPELTERLPQKVQSDQGTVQFVYLGNYIPGKGQDWALRAFAKASIEGATLCFFGGTMGLANNAAYLWDLHVLADDLDISSSVSFGESVGDVELALKQADVVLNFSESESFSLTCLEALYFGLPIVATDCGGPKELFVDGDSGLLVPVGDIDAMANAMKKLAASAELRTHLGRAAAAYVRKTYYAERDHPILAVYRTILSREV